MHGGFRFLVPSMCDHDLYLGLGDVPEPYNPNIDANGQRPRADGFLALRSALEYTRTRYATTHIFIHGTSAGSVGALNLASILSLEGQSVSGVIADSGAVATSRISWRRRAARPSTTRRYSRCSVARSGRPRAFQPRIR